MAQGFKWRATLVVIVFLMSALWVAPNIIKVPDNWWFSTKKLNYGLDIQGGVHLVMGVDIDGVIRETAVRMAAAMPESLKSSGVEIATSARLDNNDIEITGQNATTGQQLSEAVKKRFGDILNIVSVEDKKVKLAFSEPYLNDLRTRIIDQAIETIRNRVDEFGVAEPSITSQGSNRILVQLPGFKEDANKAKDLINRTARLEFMLVDQTVPADELMKWIQDAEKAGDYDITKLRYSQYIDRINKDLKPKLPKDTAVYFGKHESAVSLEAGKVPYLVRTDTGLGGDSLRDAFVGLDQYGNPEVKFSFDPAGAKKLADVTGANKGRLLAVVLDRVVKSAPVIQGQIPSGEGVITMGRERDPQKTMDEAKLISTALRAGALPATLEQLEERTVGPTLGADAVAKGAKAGIIGTVLIFIFMLVYYRAFGVIADIAMSFNLLITFAVLTSLGATLTLPGIAGLALTVGMAVDANVIIFERIKEELQKGIGIKGAVREGFDKAFSAIFDANVTTLATCLVLMYFGTGPVRGFAVTLTVGLSASMFTAVFFSRLMAEWLTHKLNWKLAI